ncbi:hypothetical protein [uncultured Roseobacter sp.]|uniref:hypothetical protein n=1 Tax=uncultured Roseobacter sp. TaxID=114847 RepID=UPI002628620F|nr:hypothetical protein [uncultured Roseobacter sp.]
MIWLEGLSYLVTILGFPAAIFVIVREERLRRENEASELHRNLSEEYDNFLRMVIDHSDLLLMSRTRLADDLDEEKRERVEIIFRILISLFEKVFILLHRQDMEGNAQRRWASWQDYMTEWCNREDFRSLLPKLLEGEDEEFRHYLLELSEQCAAMQVPAENKIGG